MLWIEAIFHPVSPGGQTKEPILAVSVTCKIGLCFFRFSRVKAARDISRAAFIREKLLFLEPCLQCLCFSPDSTLLVCLKRPQHAALWCCLCLSMFCNLAQRVENWPRPSPSSWPCTGDLSVTSSLLVSYLPLQPSLAIMLLLYVCLEACTIKNQTPNPLLIIILITIFR